MSAPDNNHPPQWATIRNSLLRAKRYILDIGDDRTMAPEVESIDNALASLSAIARHAPKPDINAELVGARRDTEPLQWAEDNLSRVTVSESGLTAVFCITDELVEKKSLGRTLREAIDAALHNYKESFK